MINKKKTIKLKGLIGLSGLTLVAGGCWISSQLYTLREMLHQAMPVDVMVGLNRNPVYIYLPQGTFFDSDNSWSTQTSGISLWGSLFPRTFWDLVFLARDKERHHKILGLRLLSTLNNLNDGICREIAQASDFQMAVGLARSNSDLRLLLPPPKLPPDIKCSDLRDDFYNVLKLFSTKESSTCATYWTLLAMQQIQKSFGLTRYDSWSGDEENVKSLTKPSKDNLLKLFFNSLQAHSTIKENRQLMMQTKLLPVLMKLNNESAWENNNKTKSLMARILGNLALDENFHNAFFQSGWIKVLAEWARSNDTELSLCSERALANLDGLSGSSKYEDGVFLAHPCKFDGEKNILVDVVFIHGLLGGAFKTWRQHDSEKLLPDKSQNSSYTYCWPKDWLAKDLPQTRIILIDYETHLTEWGNWCPSDNNERSLEARSKYLLQRLESAGVGRRPIIWVSHSMGGLLMKQILVLSAANHSPLTRKIYEQTKGAVFFSVPHRGSKIAMPRFGSHYITFPSPEVKQLQFDAKHLLNLHQQYLNLQKECYTPTLSFNEAKYTKLGHLKFSANFVTQDSADMKLGEFYSMDSDHLYICKPTNKKAFIYQRLVQFIKEQTGCADDNKSSETLAFLNT